MQATDFLDDATWVILARSLALSRRESQILRRILDDHPEAAIGRSLGISPHTVHSHLERLYRKLDVNSRCLAAVRVFEEYVRLQEAATRADGDSATDIPPADLPSTADGYPTVLSAHTTDGRFGGSHNPRKEPHRWRRQNRASSAPPYRE